MRRKKKDFNKILIQRKLSEILLKESNDPRFEKVTISRVEPSRDLSFARVYFATFPPEQIEELASSLNRAAGFFSRCLGQTLKTRNTPKLVFIYDTGFDYSLKLDNLLRQTSEEDELDRKL